MSTTEPDPTGDIAVTKSMDSALARRKIKKAMKALEKAIKMLKDTRPGTKEKLLQIQCCWKNIDKVL